jgi:hypothetical protein
MAINPNIALQARGIQLGDPLASYGRAQQIMANKMAMESNQRQTQSQNALRGLAQSGVDFATQEGGQQYIAAGGNVDELRKYQELATSREKNKREQFQFRSAATSTAILGALGDPSDEGIRRATSVLRDVFAPEQVEAINQNLTALPIEQRAAAIRQLASTDKDAREAMAFTAPKLEKQTDGQRNWLVDTNPYSATFEDKFSEAQILASPDALLRAASEKVNQALRSREIGQREREVNYVTTDAGVVPMPKFTGGGAAPAAGGGFGARIDAAVSQIAPGARVSGGARTAARNAQVGGVPNSLHLSDNARDLQPPPGVSINAFAQTLKTKMPGYDVINEGDHVHVEPKPATLRMGVPIPGTGKAPKSGEAKVSEQQAAYNTGRILNAATQIKSALSRSPDAEAPGVLEAGMASIPLIGSGAANLVRSEDRQIVAAAQEDIIDALLYLATGAAYNKEQRAGQIASYMPGYTDKSGTVAAKRERLSGLIRSAKVRSGASWTPEMDTAAQALFGGAPAKAVAPAKTSNGWGNATVVGK